MGKRKRRRPLAWQVLHEMSARHIHKLCSFHCQLEGPDATQQPQDNPKWSQLVDVMLTTITRMEDAGWRSWGPTAGATINWGRGADTFWTACKWKHLKPSHDDEGALGKIGASLTLLKLFIIKIVYHCQPICKKFRKNIEEQSLVGWEALHIKYWA